MLHQNLKALRKAKGFSQEELATRLNVVRQTISKWEKGLSVPDADLLVKMSEVLEVPTSELLGTKIVDEADTNIVVEQLCRINEQLAIKNRRAKIIWKTVAIIIGSIVMFNIAMLILGVVSYSKFNSETSTQIVTQNESVIDASHP